MKELEVGLTGTFQEVVLPEKTAAHIQSGSVNVYATPMMIALMEKAACNALENVLTPEETTVGTSVDIKHLAPTPINMKVKATAKLKCIDNRRLTFEIVVEDEVEKIGEGLHERVVVNKEKFHAKSNKR